MLLLKAKGLDHGDQSQRSNFPLTHIFGSDRIPFLARGVVRIAEKRHRGITCQGDDQLIHLFLLSSGLPERQPDHIGVNQRTLLPNINSSVTIP